VFWCKIIPFRGNRFATICHGAATVRCRCRILFAADKNGKPTDKVASIFKVTAGGSAVIETHLPGTEQEMVSVYHLDGNDLVMTHYCVLGNQPRTKADPKSEPGTIRFEFTGSTNLNVEKDMHMHGATIRFHDANSIEIGGIGWVNGKPVEEACCAMKLVRKK
jgi:hypothetical protein